MLQVGQDGLWYQQLDAKAMALVVESFHGYRKFIGC